MLGLESVEISGEIHILLKLGLITLLAGDDLAPVVIIHVVEVLEISLQAKQLVLQLADGPGVLGVPALAVIILVVGVELVLLHVLDLSPEVGDLALNSSDLLLHHPVLVVDLVELSSEVSDPLVEVSVLLLSPLNLVPESPDLLVDSCVPVLEIVYVSSELRDVDPLLLEDVLEPLLLLKEAVELVVAVLAEPLGSGDLVLETCDLRLVLVVDSSSPCLDFGLGSNKYTIKFF